MPKWTVMTLEQTSFDMEPVGGEPAREEPIASVEDAVAMFDANVAAFCRDTNLFSEAGLRLQIDQARSGNVNYTSTLWNVCINP